MPRFGETPRNVEHWLRQCRKHVFAPGEHIIKVAELGGDGQDTNFEQSFSNLAHAYLKDKAPTLLDHELGFQLVDRNQDNTKAIGVFAFKVGSQNIFAPVFFLKGDLKGHELLYLRNQDMFVPLKENWLNYILNRKPNILGSGVARQTSQLGVRMPDLNRLRNSPYKYASAIAPSIQPFMPVYAHLATGNWNGAINEFATHCQERLDLGHFLKQASLPMLNSVVTLFKQKPRIAQAFDRFHGMGVLQDAIKEAQARMTVHSVIDNPYAVNRNRFQAPRSTGSILDIIEKQAADGDKGPDYQQKVKIITWDSSQTGAPKDIDEEDQEKLLKDNLLIKDTRKDEEVSVPVNVQVEERLTNPPETGIYQVLTRQGEFDKCLVVMDPQGPDGRIRLVTVIRLDEDTRNWGNFPRKEVWVAGQDESLIPGGEDAWEDWFESLPDATSLPSSDDYDARYICIGPRRNATCPFRMKSEIGDSDGSKSYNVDFSYQCDRPNLSAGLHRYSSASYEQTDEYDSWFDGQRIHLDAKDGTDLRSNHGDLYIPKGYKIMKLMPTKADEDEKKEDDNCGCAPIACGAYDNEQSDPPPIQPGKLIDVTMQIMKKTAGLRILHDGVGYAVNGGQSRRERDAVIHLVRDLNFREDISRHMLKEARSLWASKRGVFECRVKVASPFLTDGGPSAPAFTEPPYGDYNPMGWPGQTQSLYQEDFPIPDLQAANTDPNIYNVNPANTPEPMDANNVARAAQSGQKEVFDTSMIGAMLKAVRDDTMIDRYLPDLLKAVDRLGRILFMFYWHQDQFAERYGKQDMPELEDSLRNAFEMEGDVYLFLKQKSIEPYPEEDINSLNLNSAAGN